VVPEMGGDDLDDGACYSIVFVLQLSIGCSDTVVAEIWLYL